MCNTRGNVTCHLSKISSNLSYEVRRSSQFNTHLSVMQASHILCNQSGNTIRLAMMASRTGWTIPVQDGGPIVFGTSFAEATNSQVFDFDCGWMRSIIAIHSCFYGTINSQIITTSILCVPRTRHVTVILVDCFFLPFFVHRLLC